MEEIEDNTNKQKDILCSWIGRITIVKMSILSKTIYKFNEVPIKKTHDTFHRTRTNNPKICMEPKRPQIAKAILRKKNKAGGIMLFDLRLYYNATVIKTSWYWHKNRHKDQ